MSLSSNLNFLNVSTITEVALVFAKLIDNFRKKNIGKMLFFGSIWLSIVAQQWNQMLA